MWLLQNLQPINDLGMSHLGDHAQAGLRSESSFGINKEQGASSPRGNARFFKLV